MSPGGVSQCNIVFVQMGTSKVLMTLPLQIQNSWQLPLLELAPSPACNTVTSTVTPHCNIVTSSSDSTDLYISTVKHGPPQLMQHSHPTLAFKPIIPLLPIPSFPSTPPLASSCASTPPAPSPPPDSLRVLQWNASGLQARSTELLHSLSSHSVDFIRIQESNLNSSSSVQILGISALRSDRTHYRSGILSSDATHASGGVIIFIRQGLSFSELSISSFSLRHPYFDYVEVNISLNNSSSLSFFNVYASPIRSSPSDGRSDSFSPSSRNLFILGDFNCHHPLWNSKGTSDPRGEEVFDWVIFSELLPLNDPDIPTLLHRSSPDISFAPPLSPFLAYGRYFRTWVMITYQFFYLPLSLSPVFRPSKRPPSFNFQKARWDDFAFLLRI